MKKYIEISSGKEVKLGDFVSTSTTRKFSFGTIAISSSVLVTTDNLELLIDGGYIKVVEDVDKSKKDLLYYLTALAKKTRYSVGAVEDLLENLNNSGYHKAVTCLLMQVISEDFLKKKSNPSNIVAAFNTETGACTVVERKNLESNTIYFHDMEEAKAAYDLLHDQIVLTYGKNRKQKD